MSLIERVIREFPSSHSDERRLIADLYTPSKDVIVPPSHINSILMHREGVLGNHYHEEKDEYFCLVSGNGTFLAADVNNPNLEPLKIGLKPMRAMLRLPRRTAHAFELEKGSVLIGYAINVTQGHDPNDPADNVPYKLTQ